MAKNPAYFFKDGVVKALTHGQILFHRTACDTQDHPSNGNSVIPNIKQEQRPKKIVRNVCTMRSVHGNYSSMSKLQHYLFLPIDVDTQKKRKIHYVILFVPHEHAFWTCLKPHLHASEI